MGDDETFPDGMWKVEIQRINTQVMKGENIHPKVYGCFFVVEADGDRDERKVFWPWHMITRMYQVG